MAVQSDLSVCMIVKNEAHHLAEALADFQAFADEIIVVDTGSTDQTVEIALQFTPLVYHFPWIDDFAAARNYSIDRANGRYILWLDADDRFDPEMQERINSLKAHFDGRKAFYFLLENVHENEPASFCYQLRCVPLRDDVRFQGRIHEQLLLAASRAGLELITTDITVRHMGYMDRGLCLAKMQRNLALLQKDVEEGRDDVAVHFFLALTHSALGNDPGAVGSMENAIRKMEEQSFDHHTLVEGYLFLSKIHEKTGDNARLLRTVTRASALADDCTQHHYQLALLYQKLGRHPQAAACLEKVQGRRYTPNLYPSMSLPPEGEICVTLAYSLFCIGRTSRAMEQMREAWRLGLSECESWERVGYMALAADRPDLSVQAYEAAERTGGLSADGLCNLGTLYRKQGFMEKALHCYTAALANDPHHTSTMANLGHFHLRRGGWREARELFQGLVQKGAADLDILLGLALIAATLGDRLDMERLHAQIVESALLAPYTGDHAVCGNMGRAFTRIAELLDERRNPVMAALAQRVAQACASSGF